MINAAMQENLEIRKSGLRNGKMSLAISKKVGK
jgi:hypothetical protein